MPEPENEKLIRLLRQSLNPVDSELPRDLWPKMRQRLAERATSQTWLAAMLSPARLGAVPWFDWVSLAALLLLICLFPKSIPVWLYHL
jgi:hypothetical protein